MDKNTFLSLYDKASQDFIASRIDFICAHSRFFSTEAIPPTALKIQGSAIEIEKALLSPRKVISNDLAQQNLIRFKKKIEPLARIEQEEFQNVFKLNSESAGEESEDNENDGGRIISLGEGEHRIIISLETLGPNPNFSFMDKERTQSGNDQTIDQDFVDQSHFLDKTKEQIGVGDTEEETEFERLVRLGEESSLRTEEESKFSDKRVIHEIGNILERKFVVMYFTDHEEIKSEPMIGPELVSFFEDFPTIERYLVSNIFRNQVYDSFYFKIKILPIIKQIVEHLERSQPSENQVLKDIKIPQVKNDSRNQNNEDTPNLDIENQIVCTVKKPGNKNKNDNIESPNRVQTKKKNSNESMQSKDLKVNEGSQTIQLNLNKNLSSISPSGVSSGSMVNSSLLNLQFPPNKKIDANSSGGSGSKQRRDRSIPKTRKKIFLEYGELGVHPNLRTDSGKSKNSRRSRSSKRSQSKSNTKKFGFKAEKKIVRSKAEIMDEPKKEKTLSITKEKTSSIKNQSPQKLNLNIPKKAGFLLDLLGKPLEPEKTRKKKISDPSRRPLKYKGEFIPKNVRLGSKSNSKEVRRPKISGEFDLNKQISSQIGSSNRLTSKESKGKKLRKTKPFMINKNQVTNNQHKDASGNLNNNIFSNVNNHKNETVQNYFLNKNMAYMGSLNHQNHPFMFPIKSSVGNIEKQHLERNNHQLFANQFVKDSRLHQNYNMFNLQNNQNSEIGNPIWTRLDQNPNITHQNQQFNSQYGQIQNSKNNINQVPNSPIQVPYDKLLNSNSQNFFFEFEKLKLQKNNKSNWNGNISELSGSLLDSQNAFGRSSQVQKLFPNRTIRPRQESRWNFVNLSSNNQGQRDQKFYETQKTYPEQQQTAQQNSKTNSQSGGVQQYTTPHRKSQLLFNSQNQQTFLNMNTPNSNYYSPVPSPLPNSLFRSRPLFGRPSETFLQTPVDPEISDTASMNTTSAFRLRLPNNLWKQPSPERFPKRQIEKLLQEEQSQVTSKRDLNSEGNGSIYFANPEALEMQTVDLSEYQTHFKDDRRPTLNILPDSGLFKGPRFPHKGSESSIGSMGIDSTQRKSLFGYFQPKIQHRGSMAQLYTSPNTKLEINRKASLGFQNRPNYNDQQKRASTFLEPHHPFDFNNNSGSDLKRFSMQNLGHSQKLNHSGYQTVTSVDAHHQKNFIFGLREIKEKNEMAYLQSENTSSKESKKNSPFRKVSKELGNLLNPISETRKSNSKNTNESKSKSGKIQLFGRNSAFISGEFQSFEDPEKSTSLFKFRGNQKQDFNQIKKNSNKIQSQGKLDPIPSNLKLNQQNNKNANFGSTNSHKALFNFSEMRKYRNYPLTPDARLRANENTQSLFSPKLESPNPVQRFKNHLKTAKSNNDSIFRNLKKKRISLFKDNAMMISANPLQIISSKNPFLQGRKSIMMNGVKANSNAPSFLKNRKTSIKISKLRKSSIRADYSKQNQNMNSPKTHPYRKQSSRTSKIIKKASKIIRKKSISNFPIELRDSNRFVFFPIRKLSSRLSKSKSKSKNTSKSLLKRSDQSKQEELMTTSIDSSNRKWKRFASNNKHLNNKKLGTSGNVFAPSGTDYRNRSSKKIRKFASATRLVQNKSHFSKSPNRVNRPINNQMFASQIKNVDNLSQEKNIFSKQIHYSANSQNSKGSNKNSQFKSLEKSMSKSKNSKKSSSKSDPKSNLLFKDLNTKIDKNLPKNLQKITTQNNIAKTEGNLKSLFNQTYKVNKTFTQHKKYGGKKLTNLKLNEDLKKSIYSASGTEISRPIPLSPMTQHTLIIPTSDSQNLSLFKHDLNFQSKNIMKMPMQANPKWSDYANLALMKINSQARLGGGGLFSNLKPHIANTRTDQFKSSGMNPSLFTNSNPHFNQMEYVGYHNQSSNIPHLQPNPFVKPLQNQDNLLKKVNMQTDQMWNQYSMQNHHAINNNSYNHARAFQGRLNPSQHVSGFRTYPSNSFLETDMKLGVKSPINQNRNDSLFQNLSSNPNKVRENIKNSTSSYNTGSHLMQFLDRKGSTLQRNYEAKLFATPNHSNNKQDIPGPTTKIKKDKVENIEQKDVINKKNETKIDNLPDKIQGSKQTSNNRKNKPFRENSPRWKDEEEFPKRKKNRKRHQKYVEVSENSNKTKNKDYIENQNKVSYNEKNETKGNNRRRRNRNRNRKRRRNY